MTASENETPERKEYEIADTKSETLRKDSTIGSRFRNSISSLNALHIGIPDVRENFQFKSEQCCCCINWYNNRQRKNKMNDVKKKKKKNNGRFTTNIRKKIETYF
eukprot:135907_1